MVYMQQMLETHQYSQHKSFSNIKWSTNQRRKCLHSTFWWFQNRPVEHVDKIDLHEKYANLSGNESSRTALEHNLLKDHKNGVFLLLLPGITNILVFKSKANSILWIQEIIDKKKVNKSGVAKATVSEIKDIPVDTDHYKNRFVFMIKWC